MPPSCFGSSRSEKDKNDKPPAWSEPPLGTLRHSLPNPNMTLLEIHVARQNSLAQAAADLRVAVDKTRRELDAAKNSLSLDPVRKMLGKPTIAGLTKTLEKHKAETEDLKDRWLRLKEHREVLPNQVGVTPAILREVDEGMKEIERVVVLVDRWMEDAEGKLKGKLGPEITITNQPRDE
jgi:hypothetical protein